MTMRVHDYEYDEKLVIEDFFNNTLPKFPFEVLASPYHQIDKHNLSKIKDLCRHIIDPYSYAGEIPAAVDRFLNNLATNWPPYFSTFEYTITQSQGYIALMYVYDVSCANFESTIVLYTRQYLSLKGYMDNPEGDDFFCILPVIITPPSVINNEDESLNRSYRFIELIKNANLHKVVIVALNGAHLVLGLSEILTVSYQGFEINPPPNDPSRRRSLSHMEPEEYMNAIECWGLDRVILPPAIFEVPDTYKS
ncbi:hypothetical protein MN210_18225 [Psychrobacter raelei]|uniref:Uncharacterized protein n=1 Tax=Psychrobacter raelei TaxID=2565531 RepID=A0AAU6PWF8_9GAMM